MSKEKLTNEKYSTCVCLKCYKPKCELRSIENKVCPKGEENDRRKAD